MGVRVVWKRPAGTGEHYTLTKELRVGEGYSYPTGHNGMENFREQGHSLVWSPATDLWVMHNFWSQSTPTYKLLLVERMGHHHTYLVTARSLEEACMPIEPTANMDQVHLMEELTGNVDADISAEMYVRVDEVFTHLSDLITMAEDQGWHHCQFNLEQAASWVGKVRWVTTKLEQGAPAE